MARLQDRSVNNNNAIAFAARRIPYIPELRQYCESVTACILMTQLEYWFAAMPEGFYKFLAPCEKNKLYKKGDSWTEELSFSVTEMRNAFDNIGVRYRSKNLLDDYINNGGDPFQGKPYLSFFDVKNGITYYHRNDVVANRIVSEALNQFNPILEQLHPDDVTESPEIRINDFQKSTNVTSRNEVSSFPYIKEHKITTKEDTEEDDYSKTDHSLLQKNTVPFSSSAPLLTKQERIVHTSLSINQMKHVEVAVKELQAEKYLPHLSIEQAIADIEETLLSPTSYEKAGNDFFKKLNIIKKSIVNKTWLPPIEKINAKNKSYEKKLDEINRHIRNKQSDIEHAKKMMSFASNENDKNIWMNYETEATDAYQLLIQEREHYVNSFSLEG